PPRPPWLAPWAHGWPNSRAGCRTAREPRNHGARLDHRTLDRGFPEPSRLGVGRLPLADLRARRSAAARTAAWLDARPAPHLRVGHPVRSSLPGIRLDGTAGQSRRALGGRLESDAGIRVVLHYDFVPACFSSASRMKGMVRRR